MARFLVFTILIGLMLHGVLALPRSGYEEINYAENEEKDQDSKSLMNAILSPMLDSLPSMVESMIASAKTGDRSTTSVLTDPFINYVSDYVRKTTTIVAQAIVVLAVGLVTALSICTVTPICTINYAHFGITNGTIGSQINGISQQFVNKESLNFLTGIVTDAMEKMRKKPRKN